MECNLNFKTLDESFEEAFDVAIGSEGTLYISTNSPNGHVDTILQIHPHLVMKLKDYLVENYKD